ncbi:MAG: 2-amino-4-hydroxy-6-hydroxymethyldihydropteridine diphosphokinase [Candidatus Bipolaricaulota bacterium]|nr:2-amino-4-hydroxy-6-hydroxymethyldihydropteridine diphosphokinase [Candidatus Bipolaricaulota bacterium]MCS7274178.1 2-amino-4-hydroxy-6-hydroxymethyldihydropteridine diphosphokinase [Candidatus Bipolaricaulota bacterium]MDW8110084.1 2-amino-4-hydroxy-6-hydroxymethyldihydropteridine diphosphokinase [Candidatus Bipolaricaulota bacterium]MDW8328996.1 2-amino-4-hydroxy-6-hydroxymethyldihydropteridine diphosphokinase [Candidatus Bipolaricaulota bacterium]
MRVYVGLGSNLSDREGFINAAIEALTRVPSIRVLRRARLYESAPVGVSDQPWFLNTVVELETTLSPRELLALCKEIERALGRQPRERHGPREIDLDILLYDDLVLREPDLILPHPELHRRRFVLLPLLELTPERVHPVTHQPLSQALELLTDQEVHLYRRDLD